MHRVGLMSLIVASLALPVPNAGGSELPMIDPGAYTDATLTAAGSTPSAASFLVATFTTSAGETIEIVFPHTRSIYQYSLMACIEGAIRGRAADAASDQGIAWTAALNYRLTVKIPRKDRDDFSRWIIDGIDVPPPRAK